MLRNAKLTRLLLALSSAGLLACGQEGPGAPGGSGGKADDLCTIVDDEIALVSTFGDRAFNQPVAAIQHPSDPDRWYIAEQRGIIWTMVRADGVITPRRFGDLRSQVNSEPGEGGLFSIALHPEFEQNGEVFVSYTAPSTESAANLQSRVSRFTSPDGGLTLNELEEEIVLRIEQPFDNHNGGQIAFGPDGMLYIGFGDGGSAGDPLGLSQKPTERLGKLLRIDVDVSGSSDPFGIPADNPFVDGSALPEIYASGLRNPWRFSFDREGGALWLGDVGQDQSEEINIIEKGGNYGWNVREGDDCFGTSVCEDSFAAPIATYGRDEGISVTGGFVYRGSKMPDLVGSYIFGDFGSGNIWSLRRNDLTGEVERNLLAETGRNISSFAQGVDGELFVLDWNSGNIFELQEGSEEEVCPPDADAEDAMDEGFDPDRVMTFDELYDQVLSVNCAPCHTSRALGGLRAPTVDVAFESLVNTPAQTSACLGRTRVVPGDPDNSLLFSKVSGVNLCGPMMPTTGPLDAVAIEEIRKWIEAGAER